MGHIGGFECCIHPSIVRISVLLWFSSPTEYMHVLQHLDEILYTSLFRDR
jgi:hypothetical protein